MTREEVKELLPIIQAFAEGKTIEYREHDGEWKVAHTPTWSSRLFYRIKPESKYRPFKSVEECWKEMQKHSNFGWVNYDDSICFIQSISPKGITIINWANEINFFFDECLENLTFTNGTPFGIKEE